MDEYNELEIAKNMIESRRRSIKKNQVTKHISLKLLKENNRQISAVLGITFNVNSRNFWLVHGLRMYNQEFHPTEVKRDYSIEHALEMLENSRVNTRKQNAKISKDSRKEHYQENIDKMREQARNRYYRNREKIKEQVRIRYHKNKAKK